MTQTNWAGGKTNVSVRGLVRLAAVGNLTELTVKVLSTDIVLTCVEMLAQTHWERIVNSLEETMLILLTVVCLNSGLKRDEANSLYEDNKPTGQQSQTGHVHTHTHKQNTQKH